MTKNYTLFFLALGLHFISYFLPFLDNSLGYEFFGDALNAFFKGYINDEEIILFFAFVSPVLALPFFVWDYWKKPIFKKKMVEVLTFAFFLFIPVVLTVIFVVMQPSALDDDSWGYAAWVFSFGLLLFLYIQKNKKTEAQDDEISKHLIENE